MNQSQSWFDQEFFRMGCFISSYDDKHVLFAKGGILTEFKNHESKVFFYFKDFYGEHLKYYYPRSILTLTKEEALATLKSDDKLETNFLSIQNNDEIFSEDFNEAKASFNQTLQKVVLVSSEYLEISQTEAAKRHLITKALNAPYGHLYGMWLKKYGIIGVTPEKLFDIHQNELETLALAGTAKKGFEDHLLNSPKDLVEHHLVVKNISEAIMPFVKSLTKDETSVSNFYHLIHLKTKITGLLKDEVIFEELISALSPTAALGGYPKEEALSFLRTTNYYKKFPKRYFGSIFGVAAGNWNRSLVMIRNVQFCPDSLIIESGAGIVSESRLHKELDEIKLKRKSVKELLL